MIEDMGLSSLAHQWVTLAAIAVLLGLGFYFWQFRQEQGARWQSYIQVCKVLWLFAVLRIVLSPLPVQRDHWFALYSIVALLVCYFWFRCIAELSGDERRFSAWFLPALHGLIFLFSIFILTNGWHHWYWHSISVENGMDHAHNGPIGYLAHYSGHALLVFSLWLNVRWARSCTGLRKHQAWMFVFAPIPAWIGQVLGYLSHPRLLEPQSIGFLTTGILVAWSFHHLRTYSIVPMAQQVALRSMIEGLLIVDRSGYIVKMNDKVQSLFEHPEIRVGRRYDDAVQAWPALAQIEDKNSLQNVLLERKGVARYFQIRRTPLQTTPRRILGHVLLFTEVTREKQQQDQILEQQKALAILQERDRLGRELHDGPGQKWSFLAAQTQAARLLIAKQKFEQADRVLEQLQQIIRDSNIGLRESISGLQISSGSNLPGVLEEQLRWYREYGGLQTQLELRCMWHDGKLSPYVEMQILRILQEALTNAYKSAQASQIHVAIAQESDCLHFQVEDDGQGFDPARMAQGSGHYGLRIMKERASEIGARLKVESSPGGGCKISLAVPEMPLAIARRAQTPGNGVTL